MQLAETWFKNSEGLGAHHLCRWGQCREPTNTTLLLLAILAAIEPVWAIQAPFNCENAILNHVASLMAAPFVAYTIMDRGRETLRPGRCPGRGMVVDDENCKLSYCMSLWRSMTTPVSFTSIVT